MFFTYWSNVSDEFPEPGVIDPRTGLPTGHYAEVGRVNDQARGFGRALVAARSRSVFHNGPLAEGAVTRPPRAPVYLPSRAPITTGLFESARLSLRDARESRLPRRRSRPRPCSASGRAGPSGSTSPVAAGSVSAPFAGGRIRSPSGLLSHRPRELCSGSGSPCPLARRARKWCSAECGQMLPLGTWWTPMDRRTSSVVRAGASALPGSYWWARRLGRTASGCVPEGIWPSAPSPSATSCPAPFGITASARGRSGAYRSGAGSRAPGGAGSSDGWPGRTASGFAWGRCAGDA